MRIKPYDPGRPRKPTTPAQDAARARSFRIFRLRGLYSFAGLLSPARADAMRDLVDDELISLGVPSQSQREAEDRARWARIEAREQAERELEAELPF